MPEIKTQFEIGDKVFYLNEKQKIVNETIDDINIVFEKKGMIEKYWMRNEEGKLTQNVPVEIIYTSKESLIESL